MVIQKSWKFTSRLTQNKFKLNHYKATDEYDNVFFLDHPSVNKLKHFGHATVGSNAPLYSLVTYSLDSHITHKLGLQVIADTAGITSHHITMGGTAMHTD